MSSTAVAFGGGGKRTDKVLGVIVDEMHAEGFLAGGMTQAEVLFFYFRRLAELLEREILGYSYSEQNGIHYFVFMHPSYIETDIILKHEDGAVTMGFNEFFVTVQEVKTDYSISEPFYALMRYVTGILCEEWNLYVFYYGEKPAAFGFSEEWNMNILRDRLDVEADSMAVFGWKKDLSQEL